MCPRLEELTRDDIGFVHCFVNRRNSLSNKSQLKGLYWHLGLELGLASSAAWKTGKHAIYLNYTEYCDGDMTCD